MIRVPLLNQESENKFVEVQQSKLPADVSQIISFLSQEKASIEYWLEISVSYPSVHPYTLHYTALTYLLFLFL